ncbi:unnamed protein product [Paramecium pentaurelia]|uniref:Ubiquitin-like domain-containing protein n=1 Tax=Paramecium pentaurelia TaxID=43138 RepID=A0A8S1YC74_9CILI|nr:unnamed protein product [Paramecium pentaurelia]
MQSSLGPPTIMRTSIKKICLKEGCHQPFDINEDNIRNHDSHRLQVHVVQDLVQKLHERNLKNKEELGHIQNKLFLKIEQNEKAIMALRSGDRSLLIEHLSNLTEQSESLGNPLIERNNLESYDNLFFSTRRQVKFERLDENYNKNFRAMFNELVNAQIFQNCQINCQNHGIYRIDRFDLAPNIDKQKRLLCQNDQRVRALNFEMCQNLLDKYNQQELCFEKLHQIKGLIFSLRFNLDRITNKILTEVQGLINSNFRYFEQNQKDFQYQFRFGEIIPKQTYENLAEFLSVNGQNLPLKSNQISNIEQFEQILDQIKTSVVKIHTNFGNFLDQLKPSIIKITIETIIGQDAQIQYLEVQPGATLAELFNYLRDDQNWNYQITQAEIVIDHLRLNLQQRSPEQVILQNDNDIQIQFRR